MSEHTHEYDFYCTVPRYPRGYTMEEMLDKYNELVAAENEELRKRLENVIELGNLALSVEDASASVLRSGISVMLGEAVAALEGGGDGS